ncbi:MAG: SIS domain-containing protein [bacterium]
MKTQENFKYFMLKEIFEQPDIFQKIISARMKGDDIVFEELKNKEEKIENIKKIILLGCGSSFHSCLLGGYVIEELAKINCEAEYADEFVSREAVIEEGTVVIAMSQSGKTTDVLNAVKLAKEKGALIISITNEQKSPLNELSDVMINCQAGAEKAVAATKSFTAEVLQIIFLAIKLGLSNNNLSQDKASKIIKEIKELPDMAEIVLRQSGQIEKLSSEFLKVQNLIILGKKYNYPIALEGAQKLKESAYVHAEGNSMEEFMHGSQAIINQNFSCLFIIPQDSVYEENMAVYKKLKVLEGKNIIIATEGDDNFKQENIISIPATGEIVSSLLSVISLQILSYYIAVHKGIDLNNLRNISKYVEKK